MTSALLGYLGFGSRAATVPEKNAVRALPASWYTSQDFYELERRAIFSKKWQLITHKSRLVNTGDWLKFEVAGYEFVLCRNRKGEISGFHNICRHRAFSVIEGSQNQGNSQIFACRYHGWSYGLDGKLAKAPKYDELDGFDKSKNGLFPIHVRVDVNGFVWINLDSKKTPEIPWEQDFDGIDTQERFKQYNFDDYVFDHVHEMEGPYNWKILADNFNECYHCPTTHPDIPDLADIETHDVTTDSAWICHKSELTEKQKETGTGIASTYFFPNVSTSVLPHYIMLQRFLPKGPSRSVMQYQIFRNKHSSDTDFQLINKLYRQIVTEDKALCEQQQKNLERGVFVNGELHPRLEKGPLYFQKVARETIRAHFEKEKAAKREIWPARQILPGGNDVSGGGASLVTKEDEDICLGLACRSANQEALAW